MLKLADWHGVKAKSKARWQIRLIKYPYSTGVLLRRLFPPSLVAPHFDLWLRGAIQSFASHYAAPDLTMTENGGELTP